ncbi:MAG: peptide-methionine (S)-S-oxide reductase [Gammaproteobacteria bacterium]|nr:peptide-methionine (S)-S-oxide reductase [Gammaproteobacteria bacterium]
MRSLLALVLAVAVFTSANAQEIDPEAPATLPQPRADQQVATFAGGCFWCMEPPFDHLEGVSATTSGYISGRLKNPSYDQVSHEETGHAEAIQVLFDPDKVTYERLLEVFWRNIDPTALDYQFCDAGHQYRSAIFYHDAAQKAAAISSKQALEKDKPFAGGIVTEITAATEFYPTENYHQNYYLTNPVRYKFYRYNCGRDKRLNELWGTSK